MAEGLEALLRSAQAALSAASATLPSAEERRAEAAVAEPQVVGAWRPQWVSGAGAVSCVSAGSRGVAQCGRSPKTAPRISSKQPSCRVTHHICVQS